MIPICFTYFKFFVIFDGLNIVAIRWMWMGVWIMICDFIQIWDFSQFSVLLMTVQEKVYNKPFYCANSNLYIPFFHTRNTVNFSHGELCFTWLIKNIHAFSNFRVITMCSFGCPVKIDSSPQITSLSFEPALNFVYDKHIEMIGC